MVRRAPGVARYQHARRRWTQFTIAWVPATAALIGAGLLVIGLADYLARTDNGFSLPVFWAGMLLIIAPATWRLLEIGTTRNQRLAITLLVGMALYLVKVMVSPLGFALPDEATHWRTLEDILRTGHLFQDNPLLRISSIYPGMEAATATAMVSSGLQAFPIAMLLIGLARLLTVLALFFLASAITGSARVAGIASVIYMSNASFLTFDAGFDYESLALATALTAFWATFRWSRSGGRSLPHGVLALGAIAATAVTHHLTSLVVLIFLVTWAVVVTIRERSTSPGWPIAVAAVWALLCNAVWLITAGTLAISYLHFIVQGGVNELFGVLSGVSEAKRLFVPRAGIVSPPAEVVTAYASVALLLLSLPPMLLHAVRGRRPSSIVIVLALAALLYPGSLALRFTEAGSEVSQRSSEFLFVAIGILGADWLVGRRRARWRPTRVSILLPILLIVYAGGIIAGSPILARLPGPYRVGAEQRSIEPQGTETAAWALRELGPDNLIIADRTNAKLLGSIGLQYPVSSANQHLGTAYVMFAQTLGRSELDILRRGTIQYVVVDLRLARDVPAYPYYFESAEPDAGRHTTPIPLAALQKFDALPGVTRIYDAGDIIIYDIRRFVDAIP